MKLFVNRDWFSDISDTNIEIINVKCASWITMMALRSVLAPHLGWAGAGAIKGAAARRGVTWDHNLDQHGHGGQPLDSSRGGRLVVKRDYLYKTQYFTIYPR